MKFKIEIVVDADPSDEISQIMEIDKLSALLINLDTSKFELLKINMENALYGFILGQGLDAKKISVMGFSAQTFPALPYWQEERMPYEIERYNYRYCPVCKTLVYRYEETGDVCNCKFPYEFVTDSDDNIPEKDETRKGWINVQVIIEGFLRP